MQNTNRQVHFNGDAYRFLPDLITANAICSLIMHSSNKQILMAH